MQTYLVGGAVRDHLLGLPQRERDYVVVGATREEMSARGFREVGRSFPVFLHPETGEEYALARTESKTGPGYRGFEVEAGPGVTLEQDLMRRDLTINAIAQDDSGRLIDPCGGQRDIRARVLRHVSDAFAEDPVRVLRVARFAARFHALGFSVADETLELMRGMVKAGEVAALVPERVWRETETALGEIRPDIFFTTLRECGALAVVFPEVERLFGVPQPAKWHPEIDTGVHVMMALRMAARLDATREVRFAVLAHDLGKGTTPAEVLPGHRGHEERSVELLHALCDRIGVPNRYRELAVLVARWHGICHRAAELRPATVLKLLDAVDAFRRPEQFEAFLAGCEADARGRLNLESQPYEQAALLRRLRDAAAEVQAADVMQGGIRGEAVGQALREARIGAIRAALS